MIAGGLVLDSLALYNLINDDDFIVCADGGIRYCEKMGLKANVIVGDFDSSDYDDVINSEAASNAQILRF